MHSHEEGVSTLQMGQEEARAEIRRLIEHGADPTARHILWITLKHEIALAHAYKLSGTLGWIGDPRKEHTHHAIRAASELAFTTHCLNLAAQLREPTLDIMSRAVSTRELVAASINPAPDELSEPFYSDENIRFICEALDMLLEKEGPPVN